MQELSCIDVLSCNDYFLLDEQCLLLLAELVW